MHVHILGICGSFMGGIAAIAKSLGHKVTGSDKNVYPPMSTQLEALGIELTEGYCESQFDPVPDMVVIGNAMSRGNPAVEYVLNRNLPYTSGPQWLLDNLLKDRWVIGLSGTHGKTTTSSMVKAPFSSLKLTNTTAHSSINVLSSYTIVQKLWLLTTLSLTMRIFLLTLGLFKPNFTIWFAWCRKTGLFLHQTVHQPLRICSRKVAGLLARS